MAKIPCKYQRNKNIFDLQTINITSVSFNQHKTILMLLSGVIKVDKNTDKNQIMYFGIKGALNMNR